jgi:hypothetical protein
MLTDKGATIVTFAVALTKGPTAVELAVITSTEFPAETEGGAVKVTVSPLAA